MARTGRPRKEFCVKTFKKLAILQATIGEVASFFDMNTDTLQSRCKESFGMTFSEALKRFGEHGNISLRRWQWLTAQKGSVAMQIWLGKQRLGQTDKNDPESNQPVIIKLDSTDAKA